MAANYVLLETITVGEAGASSVTFNNIPQSGYTDLKIVMSSRCTATHSGLSGSYAVGWQFNGSTTGYSSKSLYGYSASSVGSDTMTTISTNGSTYGRLGSGATAWNSSTANTFTNAEVYIPNYSVNGIAKSLSVDSATESNDTNYNELDLTAALWTGTAPITSISFAPNSSASWMQYSTFSLYGLAAVGTTPVIAPYASGGDIIQTDGTYWYHAFLSSGTFTPAKTLSCDILTVAGGGGGAGGNGGSDAGNAGGGAGGLVYLTAQSATANTSASVTVGAGGTAGAGTPTSGSQGSNSQFASLTAAVGGGYGGAYVAGGNGGSGGGTGAGSGAAGGTGSQGSNGGTGSSNSGGAGGGYGGAGGAASGNNGGVGGAGTNTYSTMLNLLNLGVSGYIAGGGGGGAKSTGGTASAGGGAGGSGNNAGTAGTSNTGGGGGGGGGILSAGTNPGGKGGSGIVIIRYAI